MTEIIKAEGVELTGIPETIEVLEEPMVLLRTINDYITFEKKITVPYIWAEDSNFYPVFYEPNVKCFLIEATCRYATASTSGKLTVEKLPSGTAKGSGQSMLASTFDLLQAANQTYHRTATTVFAGTQLNPGDVVALRPSGTLTNLRDVSVTCLFGIDMKNIPSGSRVTTIISGI